jgi:hypothetical protein
MKKVVIILILINSMAIFGQNVGIGTTNPQAKLHVNGNIFLNNTSAVKLGEGISGVDTNSGTIQLVPSSNSVPSSLKITGGGVNNEINIFAEGGTFIDGTLINTGKLIIGTPNYYESTTFYFRND